MAKSVRTIARLDPAVSYAAVAYPKFSLLSQDAAITPGATRRRSIEVLDWIPILASGIILWFNQRTLHACHLMLLNSRIFFHGSMEYIHLVLLFPFLFLEGF